MSRAIAITLLATLLAGCGAASGPMAAPRGAGAVQGLRLKAPAVQAENFKQVDKDLYRSGVPSDADMAGIAALGIKTDISLQYDRGNEAKVVANEKKVAKSLAIKFVHLPLPFAKEPPEAMVKKYLAVFDDPASLPALVHCKRGRDRTGTMVALHRMVHGGWSNEKAFKEMESFGFKKEDYPQYAKFVLEYGKARDEAKKKRDEAFAAQFPVIGSWDRE
jgi:uncharacterized protein (TIGR01244 family)